MQSTRLINICKWSGTVLLLIGALLNSLNIYPAGPAVQLVAELLWVIVSIQWRETSLIVVNFAMLLLIAGGLGAHFGIS